MIDHWVQRALIWASALTLASSVPTPVSACSIRYPEGYDREKARIAEAERAAHVVEIEVLRSSIDMGRSAKARVTRALKGDVRAGTILRLRTTPGSACGTGALLKGANGAVILRTTDTDQFFQGFLNAEQVAAVTRQGLLPQ